MVSGNLTAMSSPVATTMDASGRLVVPKAVREAAGLQAGTPLSITVTATGIEIAPAPRAVRVVQKGRLTVAVPLEPAPTLSTAAVRDTQAAVRRER
jgi:AbrB family looped-hinge helix DNA binding protein